MSLEDDLTTYLEAHAGLSALVGARIYHLKRPQGETAASVVYQLISGVPLNVASYWKPRYQFDCWAQTAKAALAVEAQLVAALDRYHGLFDAQHVYVHVLNVREGYDPGATDYRRIVDARVQYKRPPV